MSACQYDFFFWNSDGTIHKLSANLPAQGQARAMWRWYRPASTGCWSDPTKLRWADWWRWYAPVFLSPSRLMRGFLASDDSLDVDAIAIMFLRCWSFEKKDCFDRLDDQFVRWNSSTFDGCFSNYLEYFAVGTENFAAGDVPSYMYVFVRSIVVRLRTTGAQAASSIHNRKPCLVLEK